MRLTFAAERRCENPLGNRPHIPPGVCGGGGQSNAAEKQIERTRRGDSQNPETTGIVCIRVSFFTIFFFFSPTVVLTNLSKKYEISKNKPFGLLQKR